MPGLACSQERDEDTWDGVLVFPNFGVEERLRLTAYPLLWLSGSRQPLSAFKAETNGMERDGTWLASLFQRAWIDKAGRRRLYRASSMIIASIICGCVVINLS